MYIHKGSNFLFCMWPHFFYWLFAFVYLEISFRFEKEKKVNHYRGQIKRKKSSKIIGKKKKTEGKGSLYDNVSNRSMSFH